MRLLAALLVLAFLFGCTTYDGTQKNNSSTDGGDGILAHEFVVEGITSFVQGSCLPVAASLKQAGTVTADSNAVNVPLEFPAFKDSGCQTQAPAAAFGAGQSAKVMYVAVPTNIEKITFPAKPPQPYQQSSPLPSYDVQAPSSNSTVVKIGVSIQNAVTSDRCAPVILTTNNSDNLAVPSGVNRVINLSSSLANEKFYETDGCDGPPITSTSIPSTGLSQVVFFKPTGSTLHQTILTFSTPTLPALPNTAVSVTVVQGPPVALALTLVGNSSQLYAGPCYGVQAALVDGQGRNTAGATGYLLSLAASTGSATIHGAADCNDDPVNTLAISAGNPSSFFYFKTGGNYAGTLTASAPPLTAGNLPVIVTQSAPTRLVWQLETPAPLKIGAGECLELPFALANSAGETTSALSDTIVTGSFSTAINGRFYRSADCVATDPVTALLEAGKSNGSIYVMMAPPVTGSYGTFNTLASAPNLTSASVSTTLEGGAAVKLALPFGNSMIVTTNTCTPYDLQLQDGANPSLPSARTTDTVVTPTITGGTGLRLFAAAGCATAITSITIPQFARSVTTYVKVTAPGSLANGSYEIAHAASSLTGTRLTVVPSSTPPSTVLNHSKRMACTTSSCTAILSNGTLKSWGYNDQGQIGNGTVAHQSTPVAVSSGIPGNVVKLAAGHAHVCALNDSGAMYCWGYNAFGQLGTGTVARSLTPIAVPALTSGVVDIAAGHYSTYALKSNGEAFAWGYNGYGQLGLGHKTTTLTPGLIAGNFTSINASREYYNAADHACATTASRIAYCWGHNGYRQANGQATPAVQLTPYNLTAFLGNVDLIVPLAYRTHFVKGNQLKGWGYNAHGQLGDGSTTLRTVPVAPTVFGSAVTSVNGSQHTTAFISAGAAYSSGNNSYEKLCTARTGASNVGTPEPMVGFSSGMDYISSAGLWFTFALKTTAGDSTPVPWGCGINNYGQLGLSGTGNPVHYPNRINGTF